MATTTANQPYNMATNAVNQPYNNTINNTMNQPSNTVNNTAAAAAPSQPYNTVNNMGHQSHHRPSAASYSVNKRPGFFQWLKLTILDILTLALIGVYALLVWRRGPATRRMFPLTIKDDSQVIYPQFTYPYRRQYVSSLLAALLALLIPLAIILLAQFRIRSFWDLNNAILGLGYAIVLSSAFQVTLKWLVGGLRPNFYNVCDPFLYKVGDGFQSYMFDRDVCQNQDKRAVDDALQSFPSGHTSTMFAGMVFLFLYLNAKLKVFSNYQPSLWKLVLLFLPLLAATIVGGLLTVDETHNWYDVVAGAIIGIMFAFAAYRIMYAAIWDYRINHIPLNRHKGFVRGDGAEVAAVLGPAAKPRPRPDGKVEVPRQGASRSVAGSRPLGDEALPVLTDLEPFSASYYNDLIMISIRWASHLQVSLTALASRSSTSNAVPVAESDGSLASVQLASSPFDIIDAQNWVNPDNMTWADFVAPPGTNWNDPSRKGSERNFNIALVTIDYKDRPFVVTQPVGSTIYGNPLPSVPQLTRDEVPEYYRDLLNTPNDLNNGHTLHEYWMGDSHGRYGVDLTVFGAYEMPSLAYQYGISADMNAGGCPELGECNLDIRTDALGLWRADVGNETADSFELVFILSSGQDESSTWQEFGEMKFLTKEDVPEEFGPPDEAAANATNWAKTRYVDWTSWAAASNTWPNAGDGSSTQAESSGMSTYAHELSHLLDIGDNYNNPYGTPLRRAYAGPFSMMDRGSFNGPGGPHSRWQIPALEGGSMGSLHTVRDKAQLGLISNTTILHLSREALVDSGLIVAEVTARAVVPGADGLIGLRVNMDADLSPNCSIETDVLCDGGGYNHYHVEVIDRMGADSFQPDHGVMLSKTKEVDTQPFVWVIDANPQDIELIDFYRPNGTAAYITLGDYRQLLDALFHAGTRSGSEFEYVDEANNLHFYVVNINRDETGVLSYTIGVKSVDGTGGPSTHGVSLGEGAVQGENATTDGLLCTFSLLNNGSYVEGENGHPDDVTAYIDSDIYRLNATVEGDGWTVLLPNELVTTKFGASGEAKVAVAASADGASDAAVVTLTATSESDSSVVASAVCQVQQ